MAPHPLRALRDGLLAMERDHFGSPVPNGSRCFYHLRATEHDRAGPVLVARSVQDHVVGAVLAVDMDVGLHPFGFAQFFDDLVEALAACLGETLDDGLPRASRIAAIDFVDEFHLVHLGCAVRDCPLAVDGAHFAADVLELVFGKHFHDGHGSAVVGCAFCRPCSRLAAAKHHDVERAAVFYLVFGNGLGSLPPACGSGGFPIVLGRCAAWLAAGIPIRLRCRLLGRAGRKRSGRYCSQTRNGGVAQKAAPVNPLGHRFLASHVVSSRSIPCFEPTRFKVDGIGRIHGDNHPSFTIWRVFGEIWP